jgi:hypothetical protein
MTDWIPAAARVSCSASRHVAMAGLVPAIGQNRSTEGTQRGLHDSYRLYRLDATYKNAETALIP